MTNRENALRILRFERPARMMTGMPTHGIAYAGCNHESADGKHGHDSPVGCEWTDIWGVRWQKRQPGIMGYPVFHPLAEPEALEGYVWPDADDPRIYAQIGEMARSRTDRDTFLCGSHRDLLLEKAEMLVGTENLMVYLLTEPDFVRKVLARHMDFQLGIARHYIAQGVEMVFCTDDLGGQHATLLSEEMIRTFLVPEYRRLFDLYRAHNVWIELHSCGHIEPLLELFIELGIHILNPVQATANDLDYVRSVTQGRMALHGAVSSQTLLTGPIEAIRQEAGVRLRQLGAQGGYFCDCDQYLPFPPGHLEALHAAVDANSEY